VPRGKGETIKQSQGRVISRGREPPPQSSVLYSALVVFGMVLAIAGVVLAIVGASTSGGQSEIKGFGIDLKTSSTGLILVLIGVGLSAVLVLKKPADIRLFAPDDRQPSLIDRIRPKVLAPAAAVFVIALALLIADLVV
jgi:hypothetical protein